jgi:hypothetical protein
MCFFLDLSQSIAAQRISLGMTRACLGVWFHNEVEIIPCAQGMSTMPCCVAFAETIAVGHAAGSACGCLFLRVGSTGLVNAVNSVFDVQLLIGRRFDDAALQAEIPRLPFRVIEQVRTIRLSLWLLLVSLSLSLALLGPRRMSARTHSITKGGRALIEVEHGGQTKRFNPEEVRPCYMCVRLRVKN